MIDLDDSFTIDSLSFGDNTYVIYGKDDPTVVLPAEHAPISTLYIRKDDELSIGELWIKFGTAIDEWRNISTQSLLSCLGLRIKLRDGSIKIIKLTSDHKLPLLKRGNEIVNIDIGSCT